MAAAVFTKALNVLGFRDYEDEEYNYDGETEYSDSQDSSSSLDIVEGKMNRIKTIHPKSYNDARSIGETFRDGVPVIINLAALGGAASQRMIDFVSGLTFGLSGKIEKITEGVFLIVPSSVDVGDENSLPQTGFFNQS